jgi:Mlc titration factor MtfA (ptsG expression regulator)
MPFRVFLLCVCAVVALGIYRLGTARWRRRKAVLTRPFPPEWEAILTQRVAFFSALADEEKKRFRGLVSIFLDETRITGIEVELDDTCRLLVAASAIIPVFGFPAWEYSMLREVIIYPRRFDADDGLTGDQTPNTLGMVGNTGGAFNGLMVLSKPDLYRGFEVHGDRYNVGIHEFAHLVDKADGAVDGVPAGMPRECVGPWMNLVHQELDSRRDASGKIKHGGTDIPEYGYTNEQEFLAVTTEYFFESPKKFAKRHPELYEMLEKSFHQDTRRRFADAARRIFKPLRRRTGRNAPCPCGSGKKYKKCCLRKAK